MGVVERNPKDNMTSTWRTGDRKTWSRHHWLIQILNIQPTDLDKNIPVHAKDDKMARVTDYSLHRWILTHACWPLVLQEIYMYTTQKTLHPFAAFIFYTIAFKANAIHQLHLLRKLGHQHGFLDGDKHERDQVPDNAVSKVMHSLSITSTVRPLMSIFLAYSRNLAPHTFSWWLPVELGLYGIVLDFWFYWYHRCMHESDYLWKFHRTHHLTKHPNPLLTLFADSEQEIFDIAIIPLMTYFTLRFIGLPMGFFDWWICHQYIVFVELMGHSGVRVFSTVPSPSTPILKYFDCDLVIEDHDLHHRKGWKNSYNYGKQTRLWDKVFGTCTPRIESIPSNVDMDHAINIPWF